jgi:hypothetical protein
MTIPANSSLPVLPKNVWFPTKEWKGFHHVFSTYQQPDIEIVSTAREAIWSDQGSDPSVEFLFDLDNSVLRVRNIDGSEQEYAIKGAPVRDSGWINPAITKFSELQFPIPDYLVPTVVCFWGSAVFQIRIEVRTLHSYFEVATLSAKPSADPDVTFKWVYEDGKLVSNE